MWKEHPSNISCCFLKRKLEAQTFSHGVPMQGGKNNATKTFKFMLDLYYPSVPFPVGTQHPKSTTSLTSFIFSFPSSLLYLKTHKLSKIFSHMPWMSYNIYIHTLYVHNIPNPYISLQNQKKTILKWNPLHLPHLHLENHVTLYRCRGCHCSIKMLRILLSCPSA